MNQSGRVVNRISGRFYLLQVSVSLRFYCRLVESVAEHFESDIRFRISYKLLHNGK